MFLQDLALDDLALLHVDRDIAAAGRRTLRRRPVARAGHHELDLLDAHALQDEVAAAVGHRHRALHTTAAALLVQDDRQRHDGHPAERAPTRSNDAPLQLVAPGDRDHQVLGAGRDRSDALDLEAGRARTVTPVLGRHFDLVAARRQVGDTETSLAHVAGALGEAFRPGYQSNDATLLDRKAVLVDHDAGDGLRRIDLDTHAGVASEECQTISSQCSASLSTFRFSLRKFCGSAERLLRANSIRRRGRPKRDGGG